MTVNQLATILNETIVPQVLGSSAALAEDLSNIVTIGRQIENTFSTQGNLDNYVRAVLDKVGKTINWTKPYIGMAPNVLRDGWEYGSILEKNRMDLAAYKQNPTWNLQNGTDYLDGTFYQPSVSSKLYNKRTTFEVDMSFADRQFREAVTSAEGVMSFFGMIESRIKDTLTVAIDGLTMRVINNLILENMKAYDKDTNNPKNIPTVVDLLGLYNSTFSQSLTTATAFYDKAFVRWACYMILLYQSRLRGMSTEYNIDGYATHSPFEDQMLVLISSFAKAADVFLQSDTYHNELVKLNDYREVPFWQDNNPLLNKTNPTYDMTVKGLPASGTWSSTISGSTANVGNVSVPVLGVLFDKDACAICCEDSRTTSQYVPKGEFYTNFYKRDAQYLNDLAENCIIFTMGTPTLTAAT